MQYKYIVFPWPQRTVSFLCLKKFESLIKSVTDLLYVCRARILLQNASSIFNIIRNCKSTVATFKKLMSRFQVLKIKFLLGGPVVNCDHRLTASPPPA